MSNETNKRAAIRAYHEAFEREGLPVPEGSFERCSAVEVKGSMIRTGGEYRPWADVQALMDETRATLAADKPKIDHAGIWAKWNGKGGK
jgi:hypothetical protein